MGHVLQSNKHIPSAIREKRLRAKPCKAACHSHEPGKAKTFCSDAATEQEPSLERLLLLHSGKKKFWYRAFSFFRQQFSIKKLTSDACTICQNQINQSLFHGLDNCVLTHLLILFTENIGITYSCILFIKADNFVK